MVGKKRVLVVDDNHDTVRLLCQSLEEHGYMAVPAYGGVEAIQKARNEDLDCVLLDIMMPGCSGLKVCHELKRQPATKHLPIIILSAKKDPQDISYAKLMGADAYLTKPVKLSKMLESIESFSQRNRPSETAVAGQSVLLVSGDLQLTQTTQAAFDAERTGGSEWFHVELAAGCDKAKRIIGETAPRAVIIDAGTCPAEAPMLCRELKLSPDTKHIVVIVLMQDAADDIKFAWANECLVGPVEPGKLAATLKGHLRRT